MTYIPDDLRQLVVSRAQNRCEYCGLSHLGQAATFHGDSNRVKMNRLLKHSMREEERLFSRHPHIPSQ